MGGNLDPAVARVRRAVRAALAALEPGTSVVVACSGGADSLALASGCVFEAHKLGVRVVGATVDHGLQAGSADQATTVVGQLAALGVDETVSARVTIEGTGLGPEAAARRARHDVLAQIAQRLGAGLVLLGHTRDDQAETVLLGLTHGAGGRSLSGMRREYADGPVTFARPLLGLPRADTVAACEAEGLAYWTDPHNADPAYTRARIRTRVLPVLEAELGPGVAATLARTAPMLRADMDLLDDLAEDTFAELVEVGASTSSADVAALAELPDAIRTRVLRLAALAAGAIDRELTYDHVTAMDALMTGWHGQEGIDLPGHLRAVRRDGAIHLVSTRVTEPG